MAKTYRVAVIGRTGKGGYGHGLDTVWKEIPRAEVVAVSDDAPNIRELALARTGAPRFYADYRKMLDQEKPDVVAVAPRWIDRHHEMVTACLQHGCHVYMEKPFCRTLEEADDLVRLSEMTHARLAIAHQTRYCPTLQAARKLLQEVALGTILELRARGKEDHRGGAEDLWVLGSHLMNLMQLLAGEPAVCWGRVTQRGRPITRGDVVTGNEGLGPLAGDTVDAMFSFDNGITGYFGSHRGQAGKPSRFGLQVCGSKGVLQLYTGYLEPAYVLLDSSWSPGKTGTDWQTISSQGVGKPETRQGRGLQGGNVAAINDLLDAIEQNRLPLCNIYEARATIEMIMAVFESQRLQAPVPLPLTSRKHPLSLL